MSETLPLGEELLSTREAARQLRTHIGTVRRWILTGKLPGWRKGARLCVLRQDLERFLEPVRPLATQFEPRRSVVSAESKKFLESRGYRVKAV